VITDAQLENKEPKIAIVDDEGAVLRSYPMPGGAVLLVNDGEPIREGHIIAKTNMGSTKTADITMGLPQVSDLFEARRPKNPAVLAEISGTVHFEGIVKGKRVIIVEDEFGKKYKPGADSNLKLDPIHDIKHLVPITRNLLVRDGDHVEAGDMLSQGPLDPHDVLRIMGETYLQGFLMDEIQQVYRVAGITINDKHIGIIVRQMMRKVEIAAVGDTKFIYGQLVDKFRFHEENERVMAEGGDPAVARPVLQGIAKAALSVDSFLSAASFQETTRVLTNAAIKGSVDQLLGLKDNIIIGHPIPAGTGMKRYRNVKLYDEDQQDLDAYMDQVLEKRRLEKAAETNMDFDDEDSDEGIDDTDIDDEIDDADENEDADESESSDDDEVKEEAPLDED
jgi:DNA-directed RNA polymerase subunit beta'